MTGLTYTRASLVLLGAALVSLLGADLAVTALNPWADLKRIFAGIVAPDLRAIDVWAIIWTLAFAVVGVALGATSGLAALGCVTIRAAQNGQAPATWGGSNVNTAPQPSHFTSSAAGDICC